MQNLYQTFTENEVSINYLGVLDDSITAHLIGLAETYTSSNQALEKISKRVSFLIAESFQNIVRHSNAPADLKAESQRDFFQLVFLPDRILVASKNLVANKDVSDINRKIDQVNNSTQKELKELWRKQLVDGERTERGGAGLGIIEMARKSGMQLQKHFIRLSEEQSQFFLGLEIIRRDVIGVPKLSMDRLVSDYESFVNHGLQLQYNGSFAKENTDYLIDLLHKNFKGERALNQESIEIVSVMMEVLRNASQHGVPSGDRNDGILRIFGNDQYRGVACGNYMEADSISNFKDQLLIIKSKSKAELQSLKKLRQSELTNSNSVNAPLGLIDLALLADGEFEYEFNMVRPDIFFFSLEIKLKKQ